MWWVIGWLLKFMGTLLVLVLFILLCLLVIPIHYKCQGWKKESYKLYGSLSWLFNVIEASVVMENSLQVQTTVRILWWRIAIENREGHPAEYHSHERLEGDLEALQNGVMDNQKKQKKKSIKKKKSTIKLKDIFNKAIGKSIKNMIESVLQWLQPSIFRMEGCIGFEDPYYNGLVSGGLYTWKQYKQYKHIAIDIVYDRVTIEGTVHIEGQLSLGALVAVVGKHVLKQPLRGMIWKQIKEARK